MAVSKFRRNIAVVPTFCGECRCSINKGDFMYVKPSNFGTMHIICSACAEDIETEDPTAVSPAEPSPEANQIKKALRDYKHNASWSV